MLSLKHCSDVLAASCRDASQIRNTSRETQLTHTKHASLNTSAHKRANEILFAPMCNALRSANTRAVEKQRIVFLLGRSKCIEDFEVAATDDTFSV